jgi:hypothetical protein
MASVKIVFALYAIFIVAGLLVWGTVGLTHH